MPASAYFSFYPLSALRATSPTRRTRPFCRYRDISPVSAGESTPKEEARFVFARKRSDEANSREGGGLRSICFITQVVGYFACAQYDVKSPIVGVADTSPEGGSEICLCERSEANSREGRGLRSIFSVLFQGDCRGTSCLAMTTSRAMVRWDISLALNMAPLVWGIAAALRASQ